VTDDVSRPTHVPGKTPLRDQALSVHRGRPTDHPIVPDVREGIMFWRSVITGCAVVVCLPTIVAAAELPFVVPEAARRMTAPPSGGTSTGSSFFSGSSSMSAFGPAPTVIIGR
jgi:hypothetical protein